MAFEFNLDPGKKSYRMYEGVEYRNYWRGAASDKLNELEMDIISKFLPHHGRRLIDVGCGFGRLYPCYAPFYKEIIMFDGSFSLLQQAKENACKNAIFVAGDVNRLPFKNASFDAVLMVRVFHHLINSKASLAEISRVLCLEGSLIMTYHNKQNFARIIRWLTRQYRHNPFSYEPDGAGAEFMSHNPKFVQDLLHAQGYKNLNYSGVGIMDQFALKLGSWGKSIPPGKQLAPFIGRFKLAPWIFCSGKMEQSSSFSGEDIQNIFQCPDCLGPLCDSLDGYKCQCCHKLFPIKDGILDFRL